MKWLCLMLLLVSSSVYAAAKSSPSVLPVTLPESAELNIGSIFPRFVSLKEMGFQELTCKLEVQSGKKKPAKGQDFYRGSSFTLSMHATDCSVTENNPSLDPKYSTNLHSLSDFLSAECSKLALLYFRHPLTDYGRETKLQAVGGWYKFAFSSGDYKLTAFLKPDLKILREYSDDKDHKTDVQFKSENDRMIPEQIDTEASGKSILIDHITYENKKNIPTLSSFNTLFASPDGPLDLVVKLSTCKLSANP